VAANGADGRSSARGHRNPAGAGRNRWRPGAWRAPECTKTTPAIALFQTGDAVRERVGPGIAASNVFRAYRAARGRRMNAKNCRRGLGSPVSLRSRTPGLRLRGNDVPGFSSAPIGVYLASPECRGVRCCWSTAGPFAEKSSQRRDAPAFRNGGLPLDRSSGPACSSNGGLDKALANIEALFASRAATCCGAPCRRLGPHLGLLTPFRPGLAAGILVTSRTAIAAAGSVLLPKRPLLPDSNVRRARVPWLLQPSRHLALWPAVYATGLHSGDGLRPLGGEYHRPRCLLFASFSSGWVGRYTQQGHPCCPYPGLAGAFVLHQVAAPKRRLVRTGDGGRRGIAETHRRPAQGRTPAGIGCGGLRGFSTLARFARV